MSKPLSQTRVTLGISAAYLDTASTSFDSAECLVQGIDASEFKQKAELVRLMEQAGKALNELADAFVLLAASDV